LFSNWKPAFVPLKMKKTVYWVRDWRDYLHVAKTTGHSDPASICRHYSNNSTLVFLRLKKKTHHRPQLSCPRFVNFVVGPTRLSFQESNKITRGWLAACQNCRCMHLRLRLEGASLSHHHNNGNTTGRATFKTGPPVSARYFLKQSILRHMPKWPLGYIQARLWCSFFLSDKLWPTPHGFLLSLL
jgi:hypothetical protein